MDQKSEALPVAMPFAEAALQLHPKDQVAIARRDLAGGTILRLGVDHGQGKDLLVRQEIPAGHKLALEEAAAGAVVFRYGQQIGVATQAIQPGEWVHSHNLSAGDMARDFPIEVQAGERAGPGESAGRTFLGYPRPDGRFGTRNYIAVISTVNCSAQTTQAIAAHFTPERLAAYENIDGVAAITHPSGCSMPMGSLAERYLQRMLLNLARHPNCGGAIFASLGCEVLQIAEALRRAANPGAEDRATIPRASQVLSIQELGGIEATVEAGIQAVEALLPQADQCRRVPAPLSGLSVALQCGGSDGWSGISANPLVGLVSDRVVAEGGTAALAETPEIYGAEHLLTSRVRSREVGEKLVERIRWWQAQAELLGFSLDNNPTPGNKAGGLTTIFEKSLGAIAKGGSTPLMEVYEYAEWITSPGLVFMDTPGNDLASVSGMVAGGCNLALFTTGRGSVFGGAFAPTIKVASNTSMYQRMASDMDFNAGVVLEGASLEQVAAELFEQVIAVASGVRSKSERFGFRAGEFVPWQPGAML